MARGWLKGVGIVAACVGGVSLAGGLLHAATRTAPCDRTELTASIGGVQPSSPHASSLDRMTIVLVGDTGFNPTDAKVEPGGIRDGKKLVSFSDTLAGISGEVDGDLAFINLETVVTDRNDLAPEGKGKGAFHFRSHPAALKALIDAGFNLFSLANNHSYDYGPQGVEETLYHLAVANAEKAIAYAGIGSNFDEAIHPGCIDLDGTRIAFSAIGIMTGDQPQYRAGPDKPGQASYRDRPDFEATVDKLTAMPADYRILSIHYGLEGRVVPDERQLADWRGFAAGEKSIDLILGHHPHVVQGVELDGKSLIFYGLGNFLHPGTAELSRFGLCRDYGLMAKVHLASSTAPGGRGHRGDPAHRYANQAGASRRRGSDQAHLCAEPPRRRARRRQERQGRALHAAGRRLGPLLRRRGRRSRRRPRHALPGLAAGDRARQDARQQDRRGLRGQAVLRQAVSGQAPRACAPRASTPSPFGIRGPF